MSESRHISMTSTIILTLKCCIDSVQLKLSDFGLEKIDFEKILEEKLSITKTPRNVNKSLILLSDNQFEYLNPICPYCDSNKLIKQEFREINLIIDDSRPLRIYQRRYKCKNCDHKFTTSLDSIIKPNYRYANIFREKLDSLIKTGYRSLRKTC